MVTLPFTHRSDAIVEILDSLLTPLASNLFLGIRCPYHDFGISIEMKALLNASSVLIELPSRIHELRQPRQNFIAINALRKAHSLTQIHDK